MGFFRKLADSISVPPMETDPFYVPVRTESPDRFHPMGAKPGSLTGHYRNIHLNLKVLREESPGRFDLQLMRFHGYDATGIVEYATSQLIAVLSDPEIAPDLQRDLADKLVVTLRMAAALAVAEVDFDFIRQTYPGTEHAIYDPSEIYYGEDMRYWLKHDDESPIAEMFGTYHLRSPHDTGAVAMLTEYLKEIDWVQHPNSF